MFKLLKILLLLTILGVFTYFVYPVIKTRYFNHPTNSDEPPIKSSTNNPHNMPDKLSQSSNSDANQNIPDQTTPQSPATDIPSGNTTSKIDFNERGTPDSQNLAHITTEHCNNNCDAFTMDFKLLEYCQQVCGIVPVKEVSNCDNKKSIEKDYCLKDLAITKKDSKLCGGILDANIKLTCQNRILEDALENQPAPTKLDF